MKSLFIIAVLFCGSVQGMDNFAARSKSTKNLPALFENLNDEDRQSFIKQFDRMRGIHLLVPQMRSLLKTALQYSTLHVVKLYEETESIEDESNFVSVVKSAQKEVIQGLVKRYPRTDFFVHMKEFEVSIWYEFIDKIAGARTITLAPNRSIKNESKMLSTAAKLLLAATNFDEVTKLGFNDLCLLGDSAAEYVEVTMAKEFRYNKNDELKDSRFQIIK